VNAYAWITTASIPIVLVLGGCRTIEYGPMGGDPPARFAYAEKSNEPGRYVLTLVGQPAASMRLMQSFWDRRARELCAGPDFTKTMYRAERATMLYGYYGGAPGAPVLEGFLDCRATPAAPAN